MFTRLFPAIITVEMLVTQNPRVELIETGAIVCGCRPRKLTRRATMPKKGHSE
jgi:hypothetical protein